MKKKIIIIFSLLIVCVFLWAKYVRSDLTLGRRVEAAGKLTITYLGVPLSGPIFEVKNMMPGDCETRTINVENGSKNSQFIGVKSEHEGGDFIFPLKLKLMISEGSSNLYGPTHLNIFFNKSHFVATPLSIVKAGKSTNYLFKICFDKNAGNLYQKRKTKFDLSFSAISIPQKPPHGCGWNWDKEDCDN
ncbi:hypothetical protein HYS03_01565 [Candidatus Woesebacteria bacterium]|nr:hypothetical protein [Candidatus Woesebacteria bacterium]QQG47006.1 MAG: hypothetical protein HY044_02605 [Candidatus Woesebacteria bacterium]